MRDGERVRDSENIEFTAGLGTEKTDVTLTFGLLHKSMVLDAAFDASEHQDSHQSHSCGNE